MGIGGGMKQSAFSHDSLFLFSFENMYNPKGIIDRQLCDLWGREHGFPQEKGSRDHEKDPHRG
jgi:hypothetical protein